MSHTDDIKKLIINHQRRLQLLKEQRALQGTLVDPRILIEIEDIETELEKLQTQLKGIPHFQIDPSSVRSLLTPLPITPFFAHGQSSERHWANRVQQLDLLTEYWTDDQVRVVGLIGWGGVGKSSLARRWFDEFSNRDIKPDGFFWWSFYYQASLDEFLEAALIYLTGGQFQPSTIPTPWARIQQFIALLGAGKFVIVLDGLEVAQKTAETDDDFGWLTDRAFRNFLELCADPMLHQSFILITSRFPLTDLQPHDGFSYKSLQIDYFSENDGAEYLKRRGVKGGLAVLRRLSNEYGGHALSLSLLAGYLNEYFAGQSQYASQIPFLATSETTKVNQILQAYDARLTDVQKAFMQLLAAFRRAMPHQTLKLMIDKPDFVESNPLQKPLSRLTSFELRGLINNLKKRGLIFSDDSGNAYTTHPLIREYFYTQLSLDPDLKQKVNLQLRKFAAELPIPEKPTRLEDFMPLFDFVFYSCQAGFFDEAARKIHDNYVTVDRWELGYLFGAYELELSILSEFFPKRDFTKPPQVTDLKAKSFLITEVGYAMYKLGELSEALKFWERTFETYQKSLDHKTVAIVNYGLAQARSTMGNLEKAYVDAEKALRHSRLSNAKLWECNNLATLGWLAFLRGDFNSAEQYYQEANTLKWSDNPEELGLFSVLGVEYATFLLATGRINESLEKVKRNLTICRARGWQESIIHCERLLGDIAFVNKDATEASQHYREALELARNFGLQEQIVRILLGIAKVAITSGEFDEASANLVSAFQIASQLGYAIWQADICNCWSELNLKQNNFEAAKEQAHKALEISEMTDYAWGKSESLHNLGYLALLMGNPNEARDLLKNAYALRQQIQDPNAETTQELLEQIG
jgi:tetratricopeptide (TPR) repeat protein